MGLSAVPIDKLEMDKGGKFRDEASSDKVYPGLKVDCKSDLADVSKVAAGGTYTGVKNLQLKLETMATMPKECTGEYTYSAGPATCGVSTPPAGSLTSACVFSLARSSARSLPRSRLARTPRMASTR